MEVFKVNWVLQEAAVFSVHYMFEQAVPWRSMLKGAAIDFSPLTAWGVLGGSGYSGNLEEFLNLIDDGTKIASILSQGSSRSRADRSRQVLVHITTVK